MNRDRDYIREKFKKSIEKKTYLEKTLNSVFNRYISITEIPTGLFDYSKLKNLGYVYDINIKSEIEKLRIAINEKYKIKIHFKYCKELREEYGSIIKVLNRIDDIPEERFKEIIIFIENDYHFYHDDNFIKYIIDDNIEIPKPNIEPIKCANYIDNNIKRTHTCDDTAYFIKENKENKEIPIKTKIKNFFKQLLS